MQVLLAKPRGFCAGVDRAIEIVERALSIHGAPIYVRHEVVHNKFVVEDLRARGAVFVDELDEVPDDTIVIFSAHGVSQAVREDAQARGLQVFDATCPLVTKVHVEVAKMRQEGREIIMIGHRGHPEVEGTMGQLPNGIHLVEDAEDVWKVEPDQTSLLAVVTQTTLSVDDAAEIMAAVKKRFPQVREPKQQDICYATQNRQDAIKVLSPQVDVVIVVGSPSSSNSNRLRDVSQKYGTPSYMVDHADELQATWFDGKQRIGLTAGASAPDILVQQVITRLRALGAVSVRTLDGIQETIKFPLPKGLKNDA
jgi:4-hydroxy-3-methylbut-2-enyl diphosphate reductase